MNTLERIEKSLEGHAQLMISKECFMREMMGNAYWIRRETLDEVTSALEKLKQAEGSEGNEHTAFCEAIEAVTKLRDVDAQTDYKERKALEAMNWQLQKARDKLAYVLWTHVGLPKDLKEGAISVNVKERAKGVQEWINWTSSD